MKSNKPIDAVVLWVDGSDPAWLKEKAKYTNVKTNEISSDASRFREWGLFKYWFRAIEQNMPWINKIHLVTCGQVPDFLNTDCEKLNLVKHSDFIPSEYLPTFSSRAIEVNIHRINGLAEQFIYFNDDMYIMQPMRESDFFQKGLPCYEGLEGVLHCASTNDTYFHSVLNSISVVNKHFRKYEVIKKHFFKFYNIKYGVDNLRNIMLLAWNAFPGFTNRHLPMPFLKTFYEQVWAAEPDICELTTSHRFKDFSDVNQYVFRYWGIASGLFYPIHTKGKTFHIASDNNINGVVQEIITGKNKMICVNDGYNIENFELKRKAICNAFEQKFPVKSSFEK